MMNASTSRRVAILFPGDRAARQSATPATTRFSALFDAFGQLGIEAECAVYHDDFRDEVRRQLAQVGAVLVWVNPIEGGRGRTLLDTMLRDVASTGTFVSAHPDVILKMGTKEVLYRTRTMAWGCDTRIYRSFEELERALPSRLSQGGVRVLKQHRGQSGHGVWKVELANRDAPSRARSATDMLVRIRHAVRGSADEIVPFAALRERFAPYFSDNSPMIDQAYCPRLPEGMIRCYLVHDKVAGFGHQAINALCPAPPGAPPEAAPLPTPRIYHPPTLAEFQPLKQRLESDWVPEMQRLLDIATEELPVLWDCDFLLGPKNACGEDSYVLCEINCSSVAPYPESVVPAVVRATLERLG